MDVWSGLFASAISAGVFFWLAAGFRERFLGWALWRALAFFPGAAIALGVVLSPVDELGEDGLLTAHIAQHVALADLAAPLVLLGLPPGTQRRIGRSLDRLAASAARWARLGTIALSPVGAFVLWATSTYFWIVPALHRLAVPSGAVHLLDHLSFLGLGLLVWLGAFDPRRTRSWREGIRRGGLPWWARHIYAMVSRLAMLPAAFALWLAGAGTYHELDEPWRFGVERADDQEAAASVMIGFEMILLCIAVVLAFIFVSVHEGRQRQSAR